MKDYIDERNFKEKMAQSIIKRRNVVYMPKEVIEQKKPPEDDHLNQKEEDEREQAKDVLKQLADLERETERKKQIEIEKLLEDNEIARIMGEKDRDLQKTIASSHTNE